MLELKSSHLLTIEVGLENKTESSIRVDLIAFELLDVDFEKQKGESDESAIKLTRSF